MGRQSQSRGKKNARSKWLGNRARQRARGIEWNLSFLDWYDFWLSQGIDKDLKSGIMDKEALCLIRIDETKPFEMGNIMTATQGANKSGKPSRSLGRERPDTWTYRDPALHEMHIPFLRARSQSWYRCREGLEVGGWEMTFEEFVDKWGDLWPLRGRQSLDYAMSKIDFEKAWSFDNTDIITRREQIQRANAWHNGRGTGKCKRKKK